MKKNYYLLSTVLLLCCFFNMTMAQAQTNLIPTWDGDGAIEAGSEASNFGWMANPGTFTVAGSGSNRYMDITASSTPPHLLEDGSTYAGRVLLLRWDGVGETTQETIFSYEIPVDLQANVAYTLTGLMEYWNNGTAPLVTMKIAQDRTGANPLATWEIQTSETKNLLEPFAGTFTPTTNGTYFLTIEANTPSIIGLAELELVEGDGNIIPNSEFNTFSEPTAADNFPAYRLAKIADNIEPWLNGGWEGGVQPAGDNDADSVVFDIDETGKLSGANSAHIHVVELVGTDFWNNGFYKVFFEAEAGEMYEFSFDVVASEEVTFQVAMNREPFGGDAASDPYPWQADWFTQAVTATTTPQRITIETTKEILATQMHQIFFANFPAGTNYDIWIDNVMLTPIVETVEQPEAPAASQDSVVWTLGITGSNSVAATGLEAQEETVSGIAFDSVNLHRGNQRLKPEAGWPAGILAPVGGTYIQFAASTAAGYTYDIDSMSMYLGGRNNGNFRAAVYYSTNGFADSTALVTIEDINLDDATKHSVPLDLELAAEETLTFRIYPWIHEGTAVETGHWFLIQNVVLAGTASSNMPDCEAEEAPYHLVSTGSWTESDQVNLNEGDTLTFGPWPRNGYTWTWTGPNGWTAEGREPVVPNFTTEMAGNYVATYATDSCAGTITFAVTVGGTGPGTGEPDTVVNVYPTPTEGIKEVAYVTSTKVMWEGTADPIRAMLEADTMINLTVYEVEGVADAITDDLSAFDAVVIQEGFGSGDAIFQPSGDLALATIPVPFLYNKTYALRDTRALASGGGTSFEGAGMGITVAGMNQGDLLFEGITFDEDNTFRVFDTTANDLGRTDTVGTYKTFNYTQGINPFPANTLLGSPSGDTLEVPASTVFLNFLPEGTVIGSETTMAPAIFMGMNFGAISASGGENMTEEGLRLWRNAVYLLAGIGEVEQEPLADNAALFDVTLSEGSVVIMEDETTYDVELPAGTNSVTIEAATPMDENATVTMVPADGVVDVSSGSGMATITVTAEDGETAQDYVINFTVEDEITKVGGLAAEGVEIYPNPVNGNSTLNLRNAKELVSVNVYTAQGVLVRTITADKSGNISIQVSDLAEGLYLLKAVKQDRSVLTGKFVK